MIKRVDLRLNAENPREAEIMQKIDNRNQNRYRYPKDYIIQALYEFENRRYEEHILRKILQEELEKVKHGENHQELVEAKLEEDKEKVEIKMDPDLMKYLGR